MAPPWEDDVRTTVSDRIRQLMDERELSLRQVAKLVNYDASYLSKVMNGHKPLTPHLAAALDNKLEANGSLVAVAAPDLPGSADLTQLELLRQELGAVLSEGSMAGAGLDEWEQAVLRHGRATRNRPAGRLYADLIADLAELKRALQQTRTASALRGLTRSTAQMSGLMCLTLVRLDKPVASRRWARTARIAAQEADDPSTQAWVLAQEAYGHFYSGELTTAIEVARQALDTAGKKACAGAPLAAALEARAHAALGHRKDARTMLSQAEDMVEHLDAEALIPSAFGYNEAQFRFHQGNVHALLAQHEDDPRRDVRLALQAQERALSLCAPGDYTDWALTRLDRASCLLHEEDLSAGVLYMVETFTELTEQQREGIITLRGHEVVNALPPEQQRLPIVRDLQDLLMETTNKTKEGVPWPS
jgi:transcriptional regulator with XRE-family HTH domain